mmetsp:Transcript_99924/g.213969  ORF Transcript_99924/g.213969 Transcript_99924/m.213969 type:complete len:93 (-) Transcript_99924:14-292(-)
MGLGRSHPPVLAPMFAVLSYTEHKERRESHRRPFEMFYVGKSCGTLLLSANDLLRRDIFMRSEELVLVNSLQQGFAVDCGPSSCTKEFGACT